MKKVILLTLVYLTICLKMSSTQDINSNIHTAMIWKFLELRAPDIYWTVNTTTSLQNLANAYYGNQVLAALISKYNPSLPLNQGVITASGIRVYLPSIIECTKYLPVECIKKSHLLTGKPLPIQVISSELDSNGIPETIQSYPLPGEETTSTRLLQQGEFEDDGNPELLEPVRQIEGAFANNLQLLITNMMTYKLYSRSPRFNRELNAFSYSNQRFTAYSGSTTTLNFYFTDCFASTFQLKLTIGLPTPTYYPYSKQGDYNWIQLSVSNGNTEIRFAPVFATQGKQEFTSPIGYITVTLGIERGNTNAIQLYMEIVENVDFDQGESLNQPWAFYPFSDGTLPLEYSHFYQHNWQVLSNSNTSKANQAWRIVPVHHSYVRIINLWNSTALTADPVTRTILMQTPDVSSENQLWWIVPARDEVNAFKIKNIKNQCWQLDTSESSPNDSTVIFPLRLNDCTNYDTQKFTIKQLNITNLLWQL